MMPLQQFLDSLSAEQPPHPLSDHLRSLWWAKKGDWQEAHRIIQDGQDAGSSWIHAWLHRAEGDEGNAAYWYLRAGKKKPPIPLDEEWLQLVAHFVRFQH
jgi:hypothetical protein